MSAELASADLSLDVADAEPFRPKVLPTATRTRIMVYLGGLIMLLGLGNPSAGLISLPISFFLKNKLHLSAHEVANFQLIAGTPLYLSFIFGFIRDTWNPFGRGDRGYLILFGAASAVLYGFFAFIPVTYVTLLIAALLLITTFQFAHSAQNGMTAAIGQQHVMSGQISTVWNVFLSFPLIAAYLLGGVLSDVLEGKNADQAARVLFLVGAAAMAMVALYGLWKPRSVFDNIHDEHAVRAHPVSDLKRLLKHWPIYPAMLIFFLFCFSPGSVTPLQYYLQNTLHATDAQWGQWNAVFVVSFIPTYLLYGVLCQRFPLGKLLFWGAVVAVPQMIPLAFVHSVQGGMIAAVAMGLTGGMFTAASYDLIIRSCPAGLQGVTLMLSWALNSIAVQFGDVLGTHLYDHFHNFNACVIAITIVYALILPVLLFVPKDLTATADGQAKASG